MNYNSAPSCRCETIVSFLAYSNWLHMMRYIYVVYMAMSLNIVELLNYGPTNNLNNYSKQM